MMHLHPRIPEVLQLTSLYQDEHIRVIHKPNEISFHSDDHQQGIVALVKACFPDETLFPVHRLDRITSGLMIFARSQESNRILSKMLEQKQLEKYYLALTNRKPSRKQGSVIGDMKKARRGSYQLLRKKTNPAITRFFSRPLQRSLKMDEPLVGENKRWLFMLKPETGKTHQLRVAMKSMGCAVLGDQRYANQSADRAYLHAYKVRFELFGKRYELTDNLFNGEHFNFQDDLELMGSFAKPECLSWPKKSFRLIDLNS